MYLDDQTYKRDGKTYRRVLLRHSYRIGKTIKHTTIANLSNCSYKEIEAIKIALTYKDKLPELYDLCKSKAECWKLVGVSVLLYQLSMQLGITGFIGKPVQQALLNLWLIFSRLIDQGSRLSAVRLANIHAGCELIGINRLTEDDLYQAMDWLYENKDAIEKRIFNRWVKQHKEDIDKHIFLYDLSSSYFEGVMNELAFFGYNRDGKKGKKIVTYGLLTDSDGYPLGIEVFPGNTPDNKTVTEQIKKLKDKFGAKTITFVGDKGMLKSSEIGIIEKEGFHYITSISKPQIEKLLTKGIFQMSLFDNTIFEIQDISSEVRYILRRNPIRDEEIKANRNSKIEAIKGRIAQSNLYLLNHKRASVEIQIKRNREYITKLKLDTAIIIEKKEGSTREIVLQINHKQLEELGKLDGCYVIKTNLTPQQADKEIIHSRYKDLAKVEKAFKISKSELEIRPIFLRKKNRTIAHMLICMLAYQIEQHLRKCWKEFDITIMEGLEILKQIGSVLKESSGSKQIIISTPNRLCKQLLEKTNVHMPEILVYKEVDVHTNRKLTERRN
jgi:transposase